MHEKTHRQCVYLTDPVPILAFDFAQWRANLEPASHTTHATVAHAGVCNAIALFFDLHLDSTTQCTSSPHAKRASWPQALFRVSEPMAVLPGSLATVTARHSASAVHVRLVGVEGVRLAAVGSSALARAWDDTRARCEALVRGLGSGEDPRKVGQLVAAALQAVEEGLQRPEAWQGGGAQAAVLATRLFC